MENTRKWVRKILNESQDSLLVTAARESGMDIFKVLTEEELKQITGKGYNHLAQSRKDRNPA